jgi:hypothetical protein
MGKILLTKIMQDLYEQSKTNPKRIAKIDLFHGLNICIINKGGIVKLFLSRTNTYPSLTEFRTVVKAMVGAPLDLQPRRINSKDIYPERQQRYFVVAELPIQETIPMEYEN